ncbi:MAG: PAS domain-containing protein [Proteobacteria bacterium]|nr:PAS domain-containing protein [Pseudomonadota bacterium]
MMDLPAHERRITLRLLAYWERLRGERSMPLEADIDPDNLSDVWDYCFLLHVNDLQKTDHSYTYLGDALSTWLGNEEKAMNVKLLRAGYHKVVATGRPVLEEDEFEDASGQLVKFRQCLLPLGENGQVQAILGGVRFKVFA